MTATNGTANELRQIEQELRGMKSQQLVADPASAVNAYQYTQHWSWNDGSSDVVIGVFFEADEHREYQPYMSAWLENVSVPDTDYIYCEDWWVSLQRTTVSGQWAIVLPGVGGTFSGDVVVNSYVPGKLTVELVQHD